MPPRTFASLLLSLRGRIGLIAKATPVNVETELLRLTLLANRGEYQHPAFEYSDASNTDLTRKLAEIASAISPNDAMLDQLRLRADELVCESELAAAVGTPRFGELADARYECEASAMNEARALAAEWLELSPNETGPTFRTDSAAPESLLSQLSAAVREQSPYHRVVTRAGMSALAATGDECVYVAKDRWLSAVSARRVVVHEVFGHVVPRVRAVTNRDELGKLGTFQGEDTQEGYALLCEERSDVLRDNRKRELAERHLTCSWMSDGMTFPDIVRALVVEHGSLPECAVRAAIRAFRGSLGTTKGLGRERVYLPYYLQVRAHLHARPQDELRLTSGQRSIAALAELLE